LAFSSITDFSGFTERAEAPSRIFSNREQVFSSAQPPISILEMRPFSWFHSTFSYFGLLWVNAATYCDLPLVSAGAIELRGNGSEGRFVCAGCRNLLLFRVSVLLPLETIFVLFKTAVAPRSMWRFNPHLTSPRLSICPPSEPKGEADCERGQRCYGAVEQRGFD
jgi:hypothetical protein